MPAESMRLRRRLGPRDRRCLASVVCAAAVATPAGVLLGRHDVHSSAGARCVTTTRASVMGAATFRYCDQDAVAYCRRAAPADERVASQCRELGLRP